MNFDWEYEHRKEINVELAGNPRTRSSEELEVTQDGGQRLQPLFCIVYQALMELCRSKRLRVIGLSGRGGM